MGTCFSNCRSGVPGLARSSGNGVHSTRSLAGHVPMEPTSPMAVGGEGMFQGVWADGLREAWNPPFSERPRGAPVALRSPSHHARKDLEGDVEALCAGVTLCVSEKGPLPFIGSGTPCSQQTEGTWQPHEAVS